MTTSHTQLKINEKGNTLNMNILLKQNKNKNKQKKYDINIV